MKHRVVKNETELAVFAKEIWQRIEPILQKQAVILALEGPLGAGKTTFTKALAKEMGITDTIVSPTFVLHREYPGLDHIDLWRLEDFIELKHLGLERMLKSKSLIVLEWADKFGFEIENLKTKMIRIKFEYGEKENERKISYEDFGH